MGIKLAGNTGKQSIDDLSGLRVGKLTVLRLYQKRDKSGRVQWICQCDCGNIAVVRANNLKHNRQKSCGCQRVTECESRTRHGHARRGKETSTHRIWYQMLERCENPNAEAYRLYGGRGLTVCTEWHMFENFLRDMGERPKGRSIDRIDNDKGYEKANCRWADRITQARNKRNVYRILVDGELMTLPELSEKTGIKYATLYYRFKRGLKLWG